MENSKWETVKLGDWASFVTGKLDSNAATPNGAYPFFTCSRETFRTDTFAFDTECVLLAGNNAAGIFPLKYFEGKFDAYQRTYIIEPLDRTKLSTRFLYYVLRLQLEYMKSISTGAATKFLTKTILDNLEITIPEFDIQRKIADVLSAYDDLIEVNARRIRVLEAMAQSVYREWFGNVNAKSLPRGWRISRLSEIVENIRETTDAGSHLDDLPYVPIDSLPRHSLALSESKPGTEAQSSLILFKKNDILFGAMRSYFHKVVVAPFDGVTRSTCFVLKPTSRSIYSYAVMTVFQDEAVAYSHAHSRGATMPYAVWSGSFSDMPTIIPPNDLLEKFNDIIKPMLETIQLSYFRQTNLRRTRDLLLPRLVSGEVVIG